MTSLASDCGPQSNPGDRDGPKSMKNIRFPILAFALFSHPISSEEIDLGKTKLIDSVEPFEKNDSNKSKIKNGEYYPEMDRGQLDTVELPEKKVRPSMNDSIQKNFKRYWSKVEAQDGFDELRKQMGSNDIDKLWIPHFYLFDSNVVIYPGWFIIRKKEK